MPSGFSNSAGNSGGLQAPWESWAGFSQRDKDLLNAFLNSSHSLYGQKNALQMDIANAKPKLPEKEGLHAGELQTAAAVAAIARLLGAKNAPQELVHYLGGLKGYRDEEYADAAQKAMDAYNDEMRAKAGQLAKIDSDIAANAEEYGAQTNLLGREMGGSQTMWGLRDADEKDRAAASRQEGVDRENHESAGLERVKLMAEALSALGLPPDEAKRLLDEWARKMNLIPAGSTASGQADTRLTVNQDFENRVFPNGRAGGSATGGGQGLQLNPPGEWEDRTRVQPTPAPSNGDPMRPVQKEMETMQDAVWKLQAIYQKAQNDGNIDPKTGGLRAFNVKGKTEYEAFLAKAEEADRLQGVLEEQLGQYRVQTDPNALRGPVDFREGAVKPMPYTQGHPRGVPGAGPIGPRAAGAPPHIMAKVQTLSAAIGKLKAEYARAEKAGLINTRTGALGSMGPLTPEQSGLLKEISDEVKRLTGVIWDNYNRLAYLDSMTGGDAVDPNMLDVVPVRK
jgi:hypothetical protein